MHTAIAEETFSLQTELIGSLRVIVYPAFGSMRALLHCIIELVCLRAKRAYIPTKPSQQICGGGLLLRGDRNVACSDDALQIETLQGTSIERHAVLQSNL